MLLMTMLMLLSGNAVAQGVPAVCAIEKDLAQQRVELDFTPDYFFKPIPRQTPQDTREDVSVITENGNVILDMKTGDYRSVPGPFDGVPTPDGHIIISPSEESEGLDFFDRDTMKPSDTPLFADGRQDDSANTLAGVYHSAGVLPGVASPKQNYRVITDTLTEGDERMNTLMYKDFETTMGSSGPKFKDNEHPPQPLCPNLGEAPYKLPMLSKDGQQLAAYDVEAGTTKIFKIVKTANGNRCDMTRDLGFATGKVEFSPDGKKITFASDTNETDPGNVGWYPQPDLYSQNFQVFVVDLEEDTVQRISNQVRGNSYYPSFWSDGTVAYMEQAENGTYSIVRTPIASAPAVQLATGDEINRCNTLGSDFVSALALGSLWTDVCQGAEAPTKSLQGLAFTPLSLDGNKCRQLVEQRWPAYKQALSSGQKSLPSIAPDLQSASPSLLASYQQRLIGLSQNDILAACPSDGERSSEAATVSANQVGEAGVIANPLVMCMQCHSGGPNPFNFNNPASLSSEKERIYSAVFTEHMPLGVDISPETRKAMLEYIQNAIPNP
jgi:hypothetical protein